MKEYNVLFVSKVYASQTVEAHNMKEAKKIAMERLGNDDFEVHEADVDYVWNVDSMETI